MSDREGSNDSHFPSFSKKSCMGHGEVLVSETTGICGE